MNLFKYFYSTPPVETMQVLASHLPENLAIVLDEISLFPQARIITLGEPLLRLIAKGSNGTPGRMTYYWDYDAESRCSGLAFRYLAASDNHLERKVFPLPHQPSLRKAFYRNTLQKYLEFIKQDALNIPDSFRNT